MPRAGPEIRQALSCLEEGGGKGVCNQALDYRVKRKTEVGAQ